MNPQNFQADLLGLGDAQFDAKTILRDVRSVIWRILILALSAAMLSYIYVAVTWKPKYAIETTYSVTAKGTNNDMFTSLSLASSTAIRLSQIINSAALRDMVKEDLGVKELKGEITSEVIEETNLLTLRVTADSPRMAYLVLKSVMEHYPDISEFMVEDSLMKVLVAPHVPKYPINSSDPRGTMRKVFVWALLALLVLAGALSYFRDTIRNSTDIEKKLDTRLLGTIYHEKQYKTIRSWFARHASSLLITRKGMSFRYTESVQKACRKILNRMEELEAKSLMVTSCLENEGKSTVAANIALAMARSGKKVILIDLDLRKPSQARLFRRSDREAADLGLALSGRNNTGHMISYLTEEGIYAILNTRECSKSTEMLTSGRLEIILDYLKTKFDYIILDTPPMGAVADAEAIAAAADVSLCVVREHCALSRDINDMLDILSGCRAKPIGCIFNDAYDRLGSSLGGYAYGRGGYGYGYRYGYNYRYKSS